VPSLYLIDFHDTLFLGSWEPISHLLTRWGSPLRGLRITVIDKVPLFRRHFSDLILDKMISSEIIDACFSIFTKTYLKNYYLDSLILTQGTNPLFPRSDLIQFSREPVLPGALKNVNIQEYEKIFIPGIFYTIHWNLFVVDLINQTITSYDSVGNDNIKISEELGCFVNFWMKSAIQFQHVNGSCLRQEEGSLDCGAHVILNTQSISTTGQVMQSSASVRKRVLEIIKTEMKNQNS